MDFLAHHVVLPLVIGAALAGAYELLLWYERNPWHLKRDSRYTPVNLRARGK